MTEFGHLPTEVVKMIISRCDMSALLTLRLVSKSLKDAVDSSARFKNALEDVEITLHSSTLQTFVDSAPSSIPFANFSFYSIPEFYRNTPHLQKFKDTFCPRIRKLRVSAMFSCTFDAELDFFRSLKSLKDLEIQNLIPLAPEDSLDSEEDVQLKVKPPRVPFSERNWKLTRLVVEFQYRSEDYLMDWIRRCASLEVIQIPWPTEIRKVRICLFGPGRDHPGRDHPGRESYPYILRLGAEGHLQHLRTLDLNNITMRMDVCSTEDLQYFREMAADKKICLKGLLCFSLHILRDQFSLEILRNLRERIVSFYGISQLFKWEGLVNLQELKFSSVWMDGITEWNVDLEPMALPALRKIIAHIFPIKDKVEEIQDFLEGLFRPDTPRQSVTDVSMYYPSDGLGHLRAPRIGPHHLYATFPNLTRLEFRTDRFSREELCEMIEVISRKPQLEELCLRTSKGIPEEAFFGRNSSDSPPIFLKLEKLKKLRLQASSLTWHASDFFERMGDAMLEKILSKMSLTHLKIIGGGWDGLTSGGIGSLVDGPFGRNVLWIRLECVEAMDSQSGIHSSSLERLARVAHGNRLAKGRTFTSFEQFKASDEASLSNSHRFRNRGWTD